MGDEIFNYNSATKEWTDSAGNRVEDPFAGRTSDENTTTPADPKAEASTSSGEGQLLNADGGTDLVAVRFTEKEATDTEPAQYSEKVGRFVVSSDGALRVAFTEPKEGANA